jgi:biopolymer transport protein ExbD
MGVRLGHTEDELVENSEINVTPFIDVMLVLLIVFMVAAPLATVDAPVDLPKSIAPALQRTDKPLFLSLKSDLSLTLGNDPVATDQLEASLATATKGNRDERIYLRADRKVAYGDLMELMNRLRDAGYGKVALVGVDGGR